MQTKIIMLIGILLLLSACSQIDYKTMYDTQSNMPDSYPHNSTETNVETMQNGENPLKKPSYEEYRQK